MTNITAVVAVHMLWNDAANEWEIIPADLEPGPLDWAGEDGLPYLGAGEGEATDLILGMAALERAGQHPVAAEELTQMLGFAMVRATAPANADVQHRPASPGLVHMLEDAIKETRPLTTAEERGRLIRALLPIISSVDENAHRRGMFEQRTSMLAQDTVDGGEVHP